MVGPKAAAKWMSILDSGSLVDSRAVSDFSDGQTVALPFFLRLHTNNSDTHNEYTLTPINKAVEGRVKRCKKEKKRDTLRRLGQDQSKVYIPSGTK